MKTQNIKKEKLSIKLKLFHAEKNNSKWLTLLYLLVFNILFIYWDLKEIELYPI
jgi:hypothetical protein